MEKLIYENLVSGYSIYTDFCKNLNTLDGFKSHEKYVGILEHVNHYQGQGYLQEIMKTDLFKSGRLTLETIKQLCFENDRIGNPIKFNFQFIEASPTNFRYILHAILCLEHLINSKCDRIVEIGGGYGGLCLMIERISKLFDIKLKDYTIIDLEDICELQKKYLSEHKLNFDFISVSSQTFGEEIKEGNLFLISNYCLGEIKTELVDQYAEILFKKITAGFMVWNQPEIAHSVTKFFNVKSVIEYPLTHWCNKYLYCFDLEK